ncbi:MAG: carbohydrate ABC transporter permease [Clostridia bacterium]|nr:carbohydrate ABC transporter permease [Clostridia bacterium]
MKNVCAYEAGGKNGKNRKNRAAVRAGISYFFMAAMLVFFMFPFFFMFFKSFMTNEESYSLPVRFFPSAWSIVSYKTVMDVTLLNYFKNTFFVIVFNVIAVPLSASLCAYGFARVKFQGSEVLFGVVLATIMLPAIVIQIPLYVIFNSLNWIGTLYPLTIPNIFGGGAVNIFLVRQFMRGVPKEIENSAKIDGASTWRIFWNILLPLCMPILTYIIVNTFLGIWNDFMGPLIYLAGKPENYTLAIGIYYKFMGGLSKQNFPNQQMAIGVLMVIPPSVIFFVFQRQLIEGVTFGGLKG